MAEELAAADSITLENTDELEKQQVAAESETATITTSSGLQQDVAEMAAEAKPSGDRPTAEVEQAIATDGTSVSTVTTEEAAASDEKEATSHDEAHSEETEDAKEVRREQIQAEITAELAADPVFGMLESLLSQDEAESDEPFFSVLGTQWSHTVLDIFVYMHIR
eukprot:SAG31_NODE_1614_length_7741_cov_4.817849_3_plen_165_part_00